MVVKLRRQCSGYYEKANANPAQKHSSYHSYLRLIIKQLTTIEEEKRRRREEKKKEEQQRKQEQQEWLDKVKEWIPSFW